LKLPNLFNQIPLVAICKCKSLGQWQSLQGGT